VNVTVQAAFTANEIATAWQGTTDVNRANACLIAAAPELLVALQDVCARLLYRGVSTDAGHPDRTALNQARAAIAKATGGKQ
jgi:hypothetical protein